jgi:hypothetical protein
MPVAEEILNYHRFLFEWHCRNFFRFRRHLTAAEKDYLEVCFALPDSFEEVSESGYTGFSYYTYSHRVEGEQVNSSRLAYGSVAHPEPAWEAARPVLRERGLEPPRFPDSCFYGLGWDIQEQQFKLYFRVRRMQSLPTQVLSLAASFDLHQHREEGLVSLTYTGGELSETKVYLYPRQLQPDLKGEALMLTDRRGAVSQLDVQTPEHWKARLNAAGQRILEKYRERNEALDTIAYQDPDHYTLYFP